MTGSAAILARSSTGCLAMAMASGSANDVVSAIVIIRAVTTARTPILTVVTTEVGAADRSVACAD